MDNSREFFSKHQYVVLDDFLPAAECREILHAVERCKKANSLINVNQTSVTSRKKFLTFNGADIEENVPAAVPLYAKVNEVINQISGKEYAALDNKKIGLSINVTPAGGTFSWHHDRHEITAILCLNEVEGGGELEFFPNSQLLLKNKQRLGKWLQLGCDAVGLAVSIVVRKKVRVVPKPGLMYVTVGSRCTHVSVPWLGTTIASA